MKKLLAIIVLGLLWNSTGYAAQGVKFCTNYSQSEITGFVKEKNTHWRWKLPKDRFQYYITLSNQCVSSHHELSREFFYKYVIYFPSPKRFDSDLAKKKWDAELKNPTVNVCIRADKNYPRSHKYADAYYRYFYSSVLKAYETSCLTGDIKVNFLIDPNFDETTLNILLKAAKDFRNESITEAQFEQIKDEIL